MKFKLLVISPKNEKVEIKEVSESGSYFDESRVLWDERKGPLPDSLKAKYDEAIFNMSERSALEKARRDAREYLSITDWYVVRELDSGKPCPEEIKQARAQARLTLS